MLQAARDRQPLSPARLGGGTCRQEAEVPSSISAPPPSSCKREERQPGSREQQVLAKGQNRVRRLLSPVSAALCCSVRDQLGAGRGLLPTLFPRLRACNPPLPLSPRLSKHNPFRPRLEERAPPLRPHPITAGPQRRGQAMPCACITQLLSTCQQVSQALCPALQTRPIALCSS